MVLRSFKKIAIKKENRRVILRNNFVDQCVLLSLKEATRTFKKTNYFLTFRKLCKDISIAQSQQKDQLEVTELLNKEKDEYSLSLFTEKCIEEGISCIPLDGIDEKYYDSLNDIIKKRMKEEHQNKRENIWNNWSNLDLKVWHHY